MSKRNVSGKVILVTGASSGIGFEAAHTTAAAQQLHHGRLRCVSSS